MQAQWALKQLLPLHERAPRLRQRSRIYLHCPELPQAIGRLFVLGESWIPRTNTLSRHPSVRATATPVRFLPNIWQLDMPGNLH